MNRLGMKPRAPAKPTKPITVHVDAALKARAQKKARKERFTLTEVIQRGLEVYVSESNSEHETVSESSIRLGKIPKREES